MFMLGMEFKCPECGAYLCTDFQKEKGGKIAIEFFCDGAGDDVFSFRISTGLTNKDIKNLEMGKAVAREMIVKLLVRKSEQEVFAESDRKRGLTKKSFPRFQR
jgi:hypothetical protein